MTAMVNIVSSKAQMYRESLGTRLVLANTVVTPYAEPLGTKLRAETGVATCGNPKTV